MELPPPAVRKPLQKYIQRGFLLPLGVGAPRPRAPAAAPSVGVVPRVAPRRLSPLRAVVALRRPLGRRVLPPSSVAPAALPRVSRPRPPPARGWGAGIRLPPMRGVPAGCFVAWSCHQAVRRPRVARSCASACCPARARSARGMLVLRCSFRPVFAPLGNIAHYHFVTFSQFSIVILLIVRTFAAQYRHMFRTLRAYKTILYHYYGSRFW